MKHFIFPLIIIISITTAAPAYWPVTVEEDLLVAADPDSAERYCVASPYPDGSVLVVFMLHNSGHHYQIIDRYGELKYDYPEALTPSLGTGGFSVQQLLPDECSGAFVVFTYSDGSVIIAQRLDSLGNRLWGDNGVMIFPDFESDFHVSLDGEGGFLLAVSPDEPDAEYSDLWVQKVDCNGNLLWGNSGVMISGVPSQSERYPKICHDGDGGGFVAWQDHRNAYYGELMAQHVAMNGNLLWPEELIICENYWKHQIISDGEGGFIVQANPGPADFNTHWRIDDEGDILWVRDHLSWYFWADMIPGEPGFFYLGFVYSHGTYGQRMDMEGNNYWPTWGSGQPGAPFAYFPNWYNCNNEHYYYQYPYFYGIYGFSYNHAEINDLFVNVLDSLGNPLFGESGVLINTWGGTNFYTNIIPIDDGGIVSVFQFASGIPPAYYDIHAKRINADGTLGGPNAAIEDMTIAVSGSDIVLSWPSQAPSAQYYLRKLVDPYSFPVIPDTTISDTFFIDLNALSEGSQFYRVTWEPWVN
ncbi:MAG: hypothetical protein HQ591_07010 [candidate division Zixibacteria bacterium]|nr:hypothetical protein [Candidatus Tariuqbacter arcticus]